jgi:hypothetical protein
MNPMVETDSAELFSRELVQVEKALPSRISADPKNVDQGLAKLVLTIVELIRRLLERQAVRRMDAGSLSEVEIERVGETLMKLEARMLELEDVFGLNPEDLNLNLGPLGNLM